MDKRRIQWSLEGLEPLFLLGNDQMRDGGDADEPTGNRSSREELRTLRHLHPGWRLAAGIAGRSGGYELGVVWDYHPPYPRPRDTQNA